MAEVEVWELNVPGRISLDVPGPRDSLKHISVEGKGQRIRIETSAREIVEEQIRLSEHNPFSNGAMTQISGPPRPKVKDEDEDPLLAGDQQLSDDDLATYFLFDTAQFQESLPALSEVNVRRLLALFRDKGGTVSQHEAISEYIEAKWPITSGDTQSYREMQAEATRVS